MNWSSLANWDRLPDNFEAFQNTQGTHEIACPVARVAVFLS